MMRLFHFHVFCAVILLLSFGCTPRPMVNDSSKPMPFEFAPELTGTSHLLNENSGILKTMLPGTWQMDARISKYILTTVHDPNEMNISSQAVDTNSTSLIKFYKNGNCLFSNDHLLNCAAVKDNSSWNGTWKVQNGKLIVELQLNGGSTDRLTLEADVNVASYNSIYFYWNPASAEKALNYANKYLSSKNTPQTKANAAELRRFYAADGFTYMVFFTCKQFNGNYKQDTEIATTYKISEPLYKRSKK